MIGFDQYEIVKVPFPFTDKEASKIRPALVLSSCTSFNNKIGQSICAMITSLKSNNDLWPTDIIIENLTQAGLPFPSIIRFKLFTLDQRLILEPLGILANTDKSKVQIKLKQIFELTK